MIRLPPRSTFFFNDTATTEIYTLSLHDALPIWRVHGAAGVPVLEPGAADVGVLLQHLERDAELLQADRGAQAAEAGADHDHLEVPRRQLRRAAVPADGAGVLLAEAQVGRAACRARV